MEKILKTLLKKGEIDLNLAVYSETIFKASFPFMEKTVTVEGQDFVFCLKKAYQEIFQDYYESSVILDKSFLREVESKLIKGSLINIKELMGTIYVSIKETGVPKRDLTPGTYTRNGQGSSFQKAFEDALSKEFAFVG